MPFCPEVVRSGEWATRKHTLQMISAAAIIGQPVHLVSRQTYDLNGACLKPQPVHGLESMSTIVLVGSDTDSFFSFFHTVFVPNC